MKNKYFIFTILLLTLIAIMSFSSSNNSKFYYAYNEKVYLNELENKLIVRYKHNKKSDKKQLSLYSELGDKQFEWLDDSTCIIITAISEKVKLKDKIAKQEDVKSCNPVYAINTGFEMGVTDEILVRFKDNAYQKESKKLHEKLGVEVVKTNNLYQLLKVPVGSDALEIANKYQESGLTRFSHPNFICEIELHQEIPNDPYFVNQFNLNNTGQVFTDGHSGTNDADIDGPEAWAITQGSNDIVIAVIDQGVTSNHPDLPNTRQVRLNESNFADGDANNPSPTNNNNHGNACAGLISATQNNNQGISGIAPNCRIMPIRIFNTDGSGVSVDRLKEAIDFARQNGADIISNSWGFGAGATDPNLIPAIRDAIIDATTQGRNDLGCVVVFSASNSANHVQNGNGEIRFPSNVDVAGVFTVGASDRDDLQANYSPTSDPGSSNNQIIDISAPSHRAYSQRIAGETWEVWSIDIPGGAGYNSVHNTDGGNLPVIGSILPDVGVNNLSYTARFGGTSASCPQVAGVAALMLSINPKLTQQQIFDIITSTADEVGNYTYTNGISNELGSGRLNASSAVFQAAGTIMSISGPSTICPFSNTTYTINYLPTGATVHWFGLSIVSGQGTDSVICQATRNGATRLRAVITLSTEQTINLVKDIFVGTPEPAILLCPASEYPYFSTHLEYGYVNEDYYLYAYGTNLSNNDADFKWKFYSSDPYTLPVLGIGRQIEFKKCTPGDYTVSLQYNGVCGWSDETFETIRFEYNMEYSLSMYPNPTSEETTISIESVGTKAFNEDELWNIEIYSSSMIPKVKKTNIRGKEVKITTNGWQTGIYFVRVKYKDLMLEDKLIIK